MSLIQFLTQSFSSEASGHSAGQFDNTLVLQNHRNKSMSLSIEPQLSVELAVGLSLSTYLSHMAAEVHRAEGMVPGYGSLPGLEPPLPGPSVRPVPEHFVCAAGCIT